MERKRRFSVPCSGYNKSWKIFVECFIFLKILYCIVYCGYVIIQGARVIFLRNGKHGRKKMAEDKVVRFTTTNTAVYSNFLYYSSRN